VIDSNSTAGRRVGTAEFPHIPDVTVAPPRTSPLRQSHARRRPLRVIRDRSPARPRGRARSQLADVSCTHWRIRVYTRWSFMGMQRVIQPTGYVYPPTQGEFHDASSAYYSKSGRCSSPLYPRICNGISHEASIGDHAHTDPKRTKVCERWKLPPTLHVPGTQPSILQRALPPLASRGSRTRAAAIPCLSCPRCFARCCGSLQGTGQ